MLMSEPQPSRAKVFQAMNRPKIKGTVGLLTGHTTLRARMFKLRLTQQKDCQLYRDKKKIMYILYVIVQHWHAKDTELWAIHS
jgi:hypothetical protein